MAPGTQVVGLIEDSGWKDPFLFRELGPAGMRSDYMRDNGVHEVYNEFMLG